MGQTDEFAASSLIARQTANVKKAGEANSPASRTVRLYRFSNQLPSFARTLAK